VQIDDEATQNVVDIFNRLRSCATRNLLLLPPFVGLQDGNSLEKSYYRRPSCGLHDDNGSEKPYYRHLRVVFIVVLEHLMIIDKS
jgi:hypothetical protein